MLSVCSLREHAKSVQFKRAGELLERCFNGLVALTEDAGMSAKTVARIVGTLCVIGAFVAFYFLDRPSLPFINFGIQWVIGGVVAGAILAFIITPYITVVPYRWVRDQISRAAASDLVAAVIGLFVGLLISMLLAIPLANLPANWGRILPFVGAVLCGY